MQLPPTVLPYKIPEEYASLPRLMGRVSKLLSTIFNKINDINNCLSNNTIYNKINDIDNVKLIQNKIK